MPKKIVIVGAGFSGVWSALSAKRLLNIYSKDHDIQVLVIAPEPSLVLRPRLYEANASNMTHPLGSLFDSAGIEFFHGSVESVHPESHILDVRSASGAASTIDYDRLILAAGSAVVRPQSVAGLQEHGFDIDSLDSATKLQSHLKSLTSIPQSTARDTVVVCGAGFTGIELATELPKHLEEFSELRVILVEGAHDVGPELGPGPRPVITQALEASGIEVMLGSAVAKVDAEGVTLASGERIEAMTAIWTAGVRATPLTRQIPGAKDSLSRLHVDQHLRVPSSEHIFATGDAAHAVADSEGHTALMSCQHALVLGRVSGNNAAADLLGEPLIAYSQPDYVCCLDLGSWGALLAQGWERDVKISGYLAKQVKTFINQQLIYPPQNIEEAMKAADPEYPKSNQQFRRIVKGVTWDCITGVLGGKGKGND
ncbi:hypothetical protein ACJ41O_006537 [Fusarium nematophilum]